jgi:hypothetical protein
VRYGEQLIGCIDCNCWSGTKSAFVMDLSIEEIQRSETVGKHLTFDDETWQAMHDLESDIDQFC